MKYRGNILSLCSIDCFVLLQYGNTSLIEAASEGHTDTVKELLSSGATVDLADCVSAWKCVPLSCFGSCVSDLDQSLSGNEICDQDR